MDATTYPSVLEYLKDIVGPLPGAPGTAGTAVTTGTAGGFTAFYQHIMHNSFELDKRIPASLQNARPLRNLVLSPTEAMTADKVRDRKGG